MSSVNKRKVQVPPTLSLDSFTYAAIPQVVKSTLDANPTLGESEREYLLTLLTECLKEALEKRLRSGERYDWNLMAVQTSAFIPPEQAFSVVERLLQNILEYTTTTSKKDIKTACNISDSSNLDAELRLARERVAATLPPPTKPPLISSTSKRVAPPKEKKVATAKFDPFDPSLKIPTQMEDSLRKRAIDYARNHAYNLYQ